LQQGEADQRFGMPRKSGVGEAGTFDHGANIRRPAA
jgi:hypothetical protein